MSKTPNYTVSVGPINTSMQVEHAPSPSSSPYTTHYFSGNLVDKWGAGIGGKAVKLFIDGNYITSETTAADGYWSFSFSFGTVGTHTAYASYSGDASYNGCSTPTFTTVVSPG